MPPRRPRPIRGDAPDDAGVGQRRAAGQVRSLATTHIPMLYGVGFQPAELASLLSVRLDPLPTILHNPSCAPAYCTSSDSGWVRKLSSTGACLPPCSPGNAAAAPHGVMSC